MSDLLIQIKPPSRSPKRSDNGSDQDQVLIKLIEDWLVRSRLDARTVVSNSWVNRATNLPYGEFKQTCDGLFHIATTLKLMQLVRPINSPFGRAYMRLRITLNQIDCMLARKRLTRAWQRRGWPGEIQWRSVDNT